MKRILIITYYWPPSGGGGVMRWLKMSKYFPEFGWQPVVFTPANPDPSVFDYSLLNEVHEKTEIIKLPIWEPYHIYRKLTGKQKNERLKAGHISEASGASFKEKLAVFIRGNFMIPDPRIFWVKPSVRFLTGYLKNNPVDLIVTTGPPHSMHLIGLELRNVTNVPWIADFRDPWTAIDFFDKLKLTKLADRKHRKLELKVLKEAGFITTVSPNVAEGLEKLAGRKVHVVNNGFDPEDYSQELVQPDPFFSISHFGSLSLDRNPKALWEVLGEISSENPEFSAKLRIQLIGQTHESIINQISANGLAKNLINLPPQEHKKGLGILKKSRILLLPLNDAPNVMGIVPGKMYEYLALHRPVFAIGPHGSDCEKIILETNSGILHDFQDKAGMKKSMLDYFRLFTENRLEVDPVGIAIYSRKNLAAKILGIPFKDQPS